MSRIRRGGYVFQTWSGVHAPRHVHVVRDGRLVVKWNLDAWLPMEGDAGRKVIKLLCELREKGLL